MWTKGSSGIAQQENKSVEDQEMIADFELAITKLDEPVKEMLYTEFLLSYPYNSNTNTNTNTNTNNDDKMCAALSLSLEQFTLLAVPSPLEEDGNFPWMPEGCMKEDEKKDVSASGRALSFTSSNPLTRLDHSCQV